MTVYLYQDIVRDQYRRPVGGALVAVINADTDATATLFSDAGGTLPLDNPVETATDGSYSFYTTAANYELQYRYGGRLVETVINFVGPPLAGLTPETIALLAAPGTSDALGYIEGDTGSVPQFVAGKLRERITTRDFGAAGNGTANDAPATAAATTATGSTGFLQGGHLNLTHGNFKTSSSVGLTQFWYLTGDGQLSSYFSNGLGSTNDLLSTGAGFGYVDYENFGARGYRSFIKAAGQVESVGGRNLHIYNSSGYAFDVGGNFLVAQFDKLTVDGNGAAGSAGIRCGGSFNNFLLNSPQFINLTNNVFDLVFSEGVLLNSPRFEGGFNLGKSMFKLATGTHQHIINVSGYFEGMHEYIVSADGAGTVPWGGPGLLAFIGTHFTYFTTGTPYKWATTSPVIFSGCDFNFPSRVTPTAQVLGYSHNLIRSEYVSQTPLVSTKRRGGAVSGTGPCIQSLISFTRPDATNSPVNSGVLFGRLHYAASWSNADGSGAGSTAREIGIVVRGYAGNNMSMDITTVATDDSGNSAAQLAFSASDISTTGIAFKAVFATVNPSTMANFDQQWSFTWTQSAGNAANTIAMTEGA